MGIVELAERVMPFFEGESEWRRDPTTGLALLRRWAPTEIEATVYDPIVCLILQGEKETVVGDQVFRVGEGHLVVVSHDLPVQARITQATLRQPYLALVIRLDLAVLRTVHEELGDDPVSPEPARSMEVTRANEATIDVLSRYLDLIDDPVSARVLLPLVRKELHFRLYVSTSGAMLRSRLQRHSHASNVARAIQTLRERFREPLPMAELAKSVGMSTSSFHKHFRTVTMTTPLQYQKDLRLTEARRLLLAGTSTVTEAAYEVGYESLSQFSREYARKFGVPPGAQLIRARYA